MIMDCGLYFSAAFIIFFQLIGIEELEKALFKSSKYFVINEIA